MKRIGNKFDFRERKVKNLRNEVDDDERMGGEELWPKEGFSSGRNKKGKIKRIGQMWLTFKGYLRLLKWILQ